MSAQQVVIKMIDDKLFDVYLKGDPINSPKIGRISSKRWATATNTSYIWIIKQKQRTMTYEQKVVSSMVFYLIHKNIDPEKAKQKLKSIYPLETHDKLINKALKQINQ